MDIGALIATARRYRDAAAQFPFADIPRDAGDELSVFIDLWVRLAAPADLRVAEFGAESGYVTALIAGGFDARRGLAIDVYSKFQGDARYTRHFKTPAPFSSQDMHALWRRNTKSISAKVNLRRGDIRNYADMDRGAAYDLVYLGAINDCREVPAINDILISKLKIGGVLIQSDYFYWGRPWSLLQMEALDGPLALIGDLDQRSTIYVKARDLDGAGVKRSMAELGAADMDALFERALHRFQGARQGLVSLCQLRAHQMVSGVISDHEIGRLKDLYASSPKVTRFIEAIVRSPPAARL